MIRLAMVLVITVFMAMSMSSEGSVGLFKSPVSPIMVAVIDTGINLDHPHFSQTLVEIYDPTDGYSTEGIQDVCIHGTPVAGLVVDQNPEVSLLIIKASWSCWGDYGAIIKGIYHAVDRGARVITISMLGEGDYPPLHEAIIYAREHGVFIVVSGGNYSSDPTPRYPASYNETRAVSAYDYTFSSSGEFIDMSAPGLGLRAPAGGADGSYLYFTGTSASAPIVAGMASYIWSQNPELTLPEMEEMLFQSLVDINLPGYDIYTGHGRVDERKLHGLLGTIYTIIPWLTTGDREIWSSQEDDHDLDLVPLPDIIIRPVVP